MQLGEPKDYQKILQLYSQNKSINILLLVLFVSIRCCTFLYATNVSLFQETLTKHALQPAL